MVMYMWMLGLFQNLWPNVSGGGAIPGYSLLLWAFISTSERGPPWCRGPDLLGSLEPWEGGLNLVGFSRTTGFWPLSFAPPLLPPRLPPGLEEEYSRGVEGVRMAVLPHALPIWGRRNRGIAVVEDIVLVLFCRC